MSDQRQMELFEQIRAKFCEQGFSPNYASNIKAVLENALQSYVKQAHTKAPKKEILTPQQTLHKLRKIRNKALILSLAVLLGIFPLFLLWSAYQSFTTCNGLLGDSIEGYLAWHKYYNKFDITYDTFYAPTDKVDLFKYPWMVRIIYLSQNNSYCGCSGFLITDRDILTAGHCFFYIGSYEVHLGGTAANNFNDSIRILHKEYKEFVHPNYNHTQMKNDIALIKLNKPVKFSSTLHPIRLSFSKSIIPNNLTLTEWNSSNAYEYPVLKEHLIPTMPTHICEKRINRTIDDIIIGTFSKEKVSAKFCGGFQDTYIPGGNSGMSVQLMDKNGPIAFGIISVGTRQNKKGPQLFTNIYPYLHWILCNAGDDFCKVPGKR